MDLGTMTKKLKGLQYKSKAEFVYDLNLIWDNCLKYNQDMNHPLRRNANGMRKEAEKLIPLIPDLVIRSRAEVEAEERRKQNGGEDDAGDDSDDEPIMSSRGRKAGSKGTNKSRKAPSDQKDGGKEGTPNVDSKPLLQVNGVLAKTHREGSEVDSGFGTPPIHGSLTPSGANGHSGASNADAMDIDGPSGLHGMTLNQAISEEQAYEDDEYKIWKQVTKKDRALIAKERYRLFEGNKLNVDEPALLRTKAGMRRFLKSRREAITLGVLHAPHMDAAGGAPDTTKAPETLAEGMEDEVDRVVPSYYEPQTIIPDIDPKLQWVEDSEGQVINQHEDMLRLIPPGHFVSPKSKLSSKIDANIRQMQETRKLCSKIGVIKQMQIQTHVRRIGEGIFQYWLMLTPTRCTRTSSPSTTPSRSSRRTSSRPSSAAKGPSWRARRAARPCSVPSPRSSTTPASRSCSLRRWTVSRTLRATTSRSSCAPSMCTARPRRNPPRASGRSAARGSNPASRPKKSSCTRSARTGTTSTRSSRTRATTWSGWATSWARCTSA